MTSKDRYYKREYQRLLNQAFMTYNELGLGNLFGSDTPTFEEVLKYAGTSYGLKKPTKKSLKALRKVQSASGIMATVEHILPKSAKTKIDIAYAARRELTKAEDLIKKGTKNLESMKKAAASRGETIGVSSAYNDIGAVNTFLYQLTKLKIQYEKQLERFKKIDKNWAGQKTFIYNDRLGRVEIMISEIEKILLSDDQKKIQNMDKKFKEFYGSHAGGLEPKVVYDDQELDVETPTFNSAERAVEDAMMYGSENDTSDKNNRPEADKVNERWDDLITFTRSPFR